MKSRSDQRGREEGGKEGGREGGREREREREREHTIKTNEALLDIMRERTCLNRVRIRQTLEINHAARRLNNC